MSSEPKKYNTGVEAVQSLSPRVRRALEAYVTTAAKTKKAASEGAGLHPQYLTMLTAKNPIVKQYIDERNEELKDRMIDVGVLLHRLSIYAIDHIADTMANGSNEQLRLKAAIDLADRGPQTMKSSRVEVGGGLVLAHGDAKEIAAAMVEAAKIRQTYSHVTSGNDDHTNSFTAPANE